MIRACQQCGQKNRIPAKHLASQGKCGNCGAGLPPQASPLSVDAHEFRDVVESCPVPILVDFWADWCGPCKMAAPHLERVAKEWEGRAVVLKVDTEAHPELAAQFRVSGIPNFVVLKAGRVARQQAGLVDHRQMSRWLAEAS